MAKDYYTTLSLQPNATPQQIRSRFLDLARSRHPDLFTGEAKVRAEEEFQSITEAFNVLSKPERRRIHDLELSAPKAGEQSADPRQMVRVFLQRGQKALNDGNTREAALNFERATQLQDDNATAWYNLAVASAPHQRLRSKGLAAIAKACELDKMNGEYHKLAGQLFEQGGMPLRAERYYRQARKWLGDDPDVQQALSNLKKRK